MTYVTLFICKSCRKHNSSVNALLWYYILKDDVTGDTTTVYVSDIINTNEFDRFIKSKHYSLAETLLDNYVKPIACILAFTVTGYIPQYLTNKKLVEELDKLDVELCNCTDEVIYHQLLSRYDSLPKLIETDTTTLNNYISHLKPLYDDTIIKLNLQWHTYGCINTITSYINTCTPLNNN